MNRRFLILIPGFLLFVGATAGTRAQGALPDNVDLLLDSLQHATFNFFWNEASPTTGLIPDYLVDPAGSPVPATGSPFAALDSAKVTSVQSTTLGKTVLTKPQGLTFGLNPAPQP